MLAPPTPSNGCMRSSSAGSRHRRSCHPPIPLPCCFGRCLLPVKSTCARLMAGRRWLQNPLISRLTLRPDQVPSTCRRSRTLIPTNIRDGTAFRFSGHQTGGDRPSENLKSRSGKGGHPVAEKGDNSVAEFRYTKGNNRSEKGGHRGGPTVAEKEDTSSLPCGRGGRALSQHTVSVPAHTPRPSPRAMRITDYGTLNGRRAVPIDPWDGLDIPPYLRRERPGPPAPGPGRDDGDSNEPARDRD